MRTAHVLVGLFAILAPAAVAVAAGEGRYTMTPTDGGMVRLDTETGEVSICAGKDGDWTCRLAPESEKTLRGENERLIAENKGLKDEIKRLEDTLGIGEPKAGDDAPGLAPKGKIELPSEQDVDKAFDYFEGMLNKFRERLKQLEQPKPDGAPL